MIRRQIRAEANLARRQFMQNIRQFKPSHFPAGNLPPMARMPVALPPARTGRLQRRCNCLASQALTRRAEFSRLLAWPIRFPARKLQNLPVVLVGRASS